MPRAKPWVAEANRRRVKHGASKSPEYAVWKTIKQRCNNPNFKQFADYGGRGITLDPVWEKSFETFMADMGPRPAGYSVERIDNSKGYCKVNCRWASKIEQANNRTDNKMIAYNGVTKTLAEWSRDLAMPNLWSRLARGWSIEKAFTTPYKRRS